MFKKLYLDSRLTHMKPPPTYSQKSTLRNKMKQSSYTRLYKARKIVPSQSLDFHVVSNQHYMYQGEWMGQYKNGQGIALLKNGTMIVGHWQKDKLHGRSLIFTPFGAIISVYFINGKLNGWMISQYRDKIVLANLYFQDRIDGPRILFQGSQQFWMASDFENDGKLIKMTHVEKGKRNKLPLFLQNDELSDLFQKILINKNYTFDFSKIKTVQIGTTNVKFVGLVDFNNLPSGLGVTYSESQCFIGNFQKGFLQHQGRMVFNNGDIYHGEINMGQFLGHGVYYSPNKNTTMVIQTKDNNETQVIQQQSGYFLIDFEIKIGQKISKMDKIILSQTVQVIIKTMEKYYHQYYIEDRIKQQQKYSNISEQQEPQKQKQQRLKSIDQDIKQISNIVKPPNWISVDDGAISQQMNSSQRQDLEQRIKSALVNKKYFSPKNAGSLQITDQFNSIAIKQNEDPVQKQKFNLQNPKQLKTKKQLFLSTANLISSKSLDVNQLTFRGPDKSKLNKKEELELQHQYVDFHQHARKKSYQQFELPSQKNSSNLSHIDQKLNGIMKKSSLRKKIFS